MKRIISGITMFLLLTSIMMGQQTVKETFSNVTDVHVDGLFCNVIIEPSNNDMVSFTGKVTTQPYNDEVKILYKNNGGELKIWIETPKNLRGSNQGELQLKVPVSTNTDANSISGNVHIKDISGNKMSAKSVSGNVNIEGINSNIKIESVSGNCIANNTGGNLKAASVSGSVNVSGVTGSLNANTVSGSVNVKDIEGETNASSISGSVKVESTKNNVESSSTSGSIVLNNIIGDVKCNNTSGSIKLYSVSGSINAKTLSGSINGEGITFAGESYFNTMSGSIDVSSTNPQNELSFNLKSFSGSLNAKGIKGKERLVIDKGPVKIHGESFSGRQSYL